MNVLKNLEKAIITEIAVGIAEKSLSPDADLFEIGIIDSLGIMKLILFMEESFGIAINDEEIIPENFQTLNKMAKFVEMKIKNK